MFLPKASPSHSVDEWLFYHVPSRQSKVIHYNVNKSGKRTNGSIVSNDSRDVPISLAMTTPKMLFEFVKTC